MEIRWKVNCQAVGHTCTHLGILIAGEMEENEELKNLLMWGKFSFPEMVDPEIFTNAKSKNS